MSDEVDSEKKRLKHTWQAMIEGENISPTHTIIVEPLLHTYTSFGGLLLLEESESIELASDDSPSTLSSNEAGNDSINWVGYNIQEEVGRGGMGVISSAYQYSLKRTVAMKIPHSGDAQRRFVEEAVVTANLTHPNIISVHDLVYDKDHKQAMVMQMVEGQPWSSRIQNIFNSKEPGSLEYLDEELDILITVSQAISYAHNQGVLHNDLKLSNVMVGEYGDVSVMDWGCATLNPQESNPLSLPLFHPKMIESPFGSPVYMSPEQAQGLGKDIGPCTDIYLLGGILYEILTGAPPRKYSNIDEVVSKAIDGKYDPLPSHISPSLRDIVNCSLHPEIDKRYSSVDHFVSALRQYSSHREGELLLIQVQEMLDEIKKIDILKRNLLKFVAMHSIIQQSIKLGLVESSEVLLQEILSLFVDTAIQKGDLNIAQVYSEQLNDNEENKAQKLKIKKAMKHQLELLGAKKRNQRLIVGIIIVILIAMVVGSALVNNEREIALANAIRAQKQEQIARNRLVEIEELSDIQVYRELTLQADTLWPSRPEKVEEMLNWITRADSTLERLPRHIEHLHQMESEGTLFGENYRFKLATKQWEYNTLKELVDILETLKTLELPEMKTRLQMASSLHNESITSSSVVWEEAIAAIKKSPLYSGLEISPQMGMVPLNENPSSGLWEFWHIQSGEKPTKDKDGEWALTEETGIVLVLVPGGSFWMGANNTKGHSKSSSHKQSDKRTTSDEGNYDPRSGSKEMPSHIVTLDSFFISKYELTQSQWSRIMSNNPAAYAADRFVNGVQVTRLHPIEQVSWAESIEVMRRYDLTLPTEAQWEYSNRAGTDTIYWTGDTIKSLRGATNISDQQSRDNGGPESWAVEKDLSDPFIIHGPVGSFRPNAFGLHDTIGNVWEWCLDLHGPYSLPVEAETGKRKVLDDNAMHLFRGGGFRANSIHVRSADRYSIYAADYRAYDVGIRPARSIQ